MSTSSSICASEGCTLRVSEGCTTCDFCQACARIRQEYDPKIAAAEKAKEYAKLINLKNQRQADIDSAFHYFCCYQDERTGEWTQYQMSSSQAPAECLCGKPATVNSSTMGYVCRDCAGNN